MNKQLLASYVAQLNHNVVALQSILATQQFLWGQIAPMLLGGGVLPVASIVPISGNVGNVKRTKPGLKTKTAISAVA